MSIDEYNHHARLGPLAGPPTNASQLAGQQAYDQANQRPAGGPYIAPNSRGPAGEIPKFLREGALRRGLWLLAILLVVTPLATLLLRTGSGLQVAVTAISSLLFVFALFLVACGLIARFAGRGKKP